MFNFTQNSQSESQLTGASVVREQTRDCPLRQHSAEFGDPQLFVQLVRKHTPMMSLWLGSPRWPWQSTTASATRQTCPARKPRCHQMIQHWPESRLAKSIEYNSNFHFQIVTQRSEVFNCFASRMYSCLIWKLKCQSRTQINNDKTAIATVVLPHLMSHSVTTCTLPITAVLPQFSPSSW